MQQTQAQDPSTTYSALTAAQQASTIGQPTAGQPLGYGSDGVTNPAFGMTTTTPMNPPTIGALPAPAGASGMTVDGTPVTLGAAPSGAAAMPMTGGMSMSGVSLNNSWDPSLPLAPNDFLVREPQLLCNSMLLLRLIKCRRFEVCVQHVYAEPDC